MMDIAYITMYSGMSHSDPKAELDETQSLFVRAKLASLSTPFTGKRLYGTGVLGMYNYMVILKDIQTVVYCTINGCVTIMHGMNSEEYVDSAGLHEYLSGILIPAFDRHIAELHAKQDEFYEKMFRVSEQNKV